MDNRLPGPVRRDANGNVIVSHPMYPAPDMMAPGMDYSEAMRDGPMNPMRPVDGSGMSVDGLRVTMP